MASPWEGRELDRLDLLRANAGRLQSLLAFARFLLLAQALLLFGIRSGCRLIGTGLGQNKTREE